jgi:DNA-3-methyladenine glycosylase
VARALIGETLVHVWPDGTRIAGRIVETEAYRGNDPACHAWGLRNLERPTKGKGHELYGPPGFAYVYLCYGVHWLFNFITEPEGRAGAVLLRALEPLEGIESMREGRGGFAGPLHEIARGPGRVTRALGIDGASHGRSVSEDTLFVERRGGRPRVVAGPRIGISQGQDLQWRYGLRGSMFMSRPTLGA